MKYLKKYGLFESNTDIDSICQKYGIQDYTINSDGTVDVDGDVNLFERNLSKLPLKFGRVTGSFYCFNNELTTLEGCPKSVGANFNCSGNKLTTLEGCPEEVGGSFDCHINQLTTLDGCPKEVDDSFVCCHNQLTSLEGCPKEVGGGFYCGSNELTTLEGCPNEVGGSFYCNNNQLTSLRGCPKEVVGNFNCYSNQLTIINDELEFVKIMLNFNIQGNPIYEVYRLFSKFKYFKDSLDYNYFISPNQIVRHRFEEACQEAGITVPEKIIGYEYI